MNCKDKVLFGLMAASLITSMLVTFQRDRALRERDEARIDTKLIASLYNGLLIGRGCGVPNE